MSLKKYVIIYSRLDYLIKNHATGKPKELSRKLGVSQRQTANYIKDMRDLGHIIEYSSSLNSYIFKGKDNDLESF